MGHHMVKVDSVPMEPDNDVDKVEAVLLDARRSSPFEIGDNSMRILKIAGAYTMIALIILAMIFSVMLPLLAGPFFLCELPAECREVRVSLLLWLS